MDIRNVREETEKLEMGRENVKMSSEKTNNDP